MNSWEDILSPSTVATIFVLPPLNTSPIPQKINGRIIIATSSFIKKDFEKNAISFLSKLHLLNKKLNKCTNPSFIPKDINKYLLKLIVENP